MPPKRNASSAGSRAKKPRPSNESPAKPPAAEPPGPAGDANNDSGDEFANDEERAAAAAAIPRNKRWSAVSGSANADGDYKFAIRNPAKAYKFVCMCRPPFVNGEEEEEDGEEVVERDGTKKSKRAKCDGGKTCLCDKPAAEHMEHPWKFTFAGKRKFFTQLTHCQLRSPDNFGMYTFNDHEGYGVVEVLQNMVLDFEEAEGNYKEQWAVCEALGMFLKTDFAGDLSHVDGADLIDATYQLIGRLFMSMLALLERKNLLSKDSEIKNLDVVMAIFLEVAHGARCYGFLEDPATEALGPAKDKKTWQPDYFDNNIVAYARKYDIELTGIHGLDKLIEDADADVDLPVPTSNAADKADPFGFVKGLKAYKKEHGGVTAFLAQTKKPNSVIGGDHLDITSWTSAKRKSKAFNEKDPLGKEELAALKKGAVLSLA